MSDSVYRLARAQALVLCGVLVVAAAALVFAAFVLVSGDGWVRGLGWAAAAAAVLSVAGAAAVGLRPPVVARLSAAGFVFTRPRRARGRWEDVDDVQLDGRVLELSGESMVSVQLDWDAVEPAQRPALAREVYDRLNTVNGYTRFS